MEKAIEIKRRAQRCLQNGDLDGALAEYEKLVGAPDSDPYNLVLLADLLFKKANPQAAAERYLSAATEYEKAGLYKNGIAVCKKMMRLSLAPVAVYERLAALHALDGLATEASLYYMQHAELLVRENKAVDASRSLRLAFDTSNDNVKALERLGEVKVLSGDNPAAAQVLLEAAAKYERLGQASDAERCRKRALQMDATVDVEGPPNTELRTQEIAAEPSTPSVYRLPDPSDRTLDASALPSVNGARVLEDSKTQDSDRVGAGDNVERVALDARFERLDLDVREAGPARLNLVEDAARSGGRTDAPTLESASNDADSAGDERPELPAELSEGNGPPQLHDQSPQAPGLQFPAAQEVESAPARPGLAEVEHLLGRAQEYFRSGNREAATAALTDAARAYEELGRVENAASIYRSLGKSAHASAEILKLWLENCERREDRSEGAQVACELGDRALNAGDLAGAKRWFELALELEPGNELSARRLQRLLPAVDAGAPAVAGKPELSEPGPVVEPMSAADESTVRPPAALGNFPVSGVAAAPMRQATPSSGGLPEPGRVEVAVGRGEAVTFDLGSLISEFQRGIEAQLSGDAQSHYDLAMAYREMGLLEQAVESFRVSSSSPEFAGRAAEMIGRCLLDQGQFEEAAREFARVLEQGSLDPGTACELSFHLGLAYEAAGRMQEALAQFERVYAEQPNFPDVALKIRVLRKSLERV